MIQVINLQKSFDSKPILRGIDLTVNDGEFLVIIGQSGCGKSLLLKHLIGLEFQDEGEIRIAGTTLSNDARTLKTVRSVVSMLFQNGALFDSLSVLDNVTFALVESKKLKETEAKTRAMDCLSMVGLEATIKQYPYQLSGGMRKRLAMARAIALQPKYILYDEPTSGLDPVTTQSINQLMVQLSRSLDITSIAVTHDMQSAAQIASQIAFMNNGLIEWIGEANQVQKTKKRSLDNFIQGIASEVS